MMTIGKSSLFPRHPTKKALHYLGGMDLDAHVHVFKIVI
jgi:hypothetical protein